jgi:hypothetical protein
LLRTSLTFCALIAVGLLVASPAGARPHPTPTPSATPTPPPADPAVTKLARQQFLAWQIGSIEKSLYDPRLLAQLTDAKIAETSKAIAPLGALIDTVYVGPFTGSDFPPDAKGYVYQMTCTQGKMYEFVVLTGEGKIATMFFRDTLTTEEITGPAVHSPAPPTAKP